MVLALSYVLVMAVSFGVAFAARRNLRVFDRARSRWRSADRLGPAMIISLMCLGVWRVWGTIVWIAALSLSALMAWSVGRVHKRAEEIPKRPLGL